MKCSECSRTIFIPDYIRKNKKGYVLEHITGAKAVRIKELTTLDSCVNYLFDTYSTNFKIAPTHDNGKFAKDYYIWWD